MITYGSQVDLQAQMERAAIPSFDYRHGGLSHILVTMKELGVRTGHVAEADQAVAAIESRLAAVRANVAGKRRPRILLVFSREPMMMFAPVPQFTSMVLVSFKNQTRILNRKSFGLKHSTKTIFCARE